MMDILAMIAELERDEGLRLKVYSDAAEDDLSRLKGKLTIGIGRNLVDNGINKAEAYAMLREDIENTAVGLDQHLSWWRGLDEVRQRALLNMAFNLGIWPEKGGKLLLFKSTLALIRDGRYAEAASHILELPWAKQVTVRAQRIAKMLATGAAVGLCLALGCSTQKKAESEVHAVASVQTHIEDDTHEVGEVAGDLDTTSKAERRESRQPSATDIDETLTVYAPDGGVASKKERKFHHTTGQVDIDSAKTTDAKATVKADAKKDDHLAVDQDAGVHLDGKVKTENDVDVGPGWHFYLYGTVVAAGALAALYVYLKVIRKVSWL